MKTFVAWVLVVLFLFGISLGIWKLLDLTAEPVVQEIVGQGEVASVDYLQGNWSSSDKTIVRFKDGSTAALDGSWSIPIGNITILKPGQDLWKYEIIKEAK